MRDLVNKVLEVIEKNPGVRASEIASYLGVDRRAVYRALQVLKMRGLVKRVGVGYYPTKPRSTEAQKPLPIKPRQSEVQPLAAEERERDRCKDAKELLERVSRDFMEVQRICTDLVMSILDALASSKHVPSQALDLQTPLIMDIDSFRTYIERAGLYELCHEYVRIHNVVVKKSLLEELAKVFTEDPELLNPVERALAESYIEIVRKGAIQAPC